MTRTSATPFALPFLAANSMTGLRISKFRQIAFLVVSRTLSKGEAARQLKAQGYTTDEELRRLNRYIVEMQTEHDRIRSAINALPAKDSALHLESGAVREWYSPSARPRITN